MCECGFPLSAGQARLVLGVSVFAQPHGAGASPGEAVASPCNPALCNFAHRGQDLHP